MIEKAFPASQLWTLSPENHPTRYYIYTGGLIHQKTSATSSFQWAVAPQRSCTPSWGGCRSRLTICQLNQFNTNSEAAILSSPIRQYWITLKLGVDPKQIEPQFEIELHALHMQRRGLLVKAWSTRSFTNQRGRFWIPVVWFSPLLSLLMRLSLTPALCFGEQRLVKHDLLPLYRRAENWKRRCWHHQLLPVMLQNKGMIGFLICIY